MQETIISIYPGEASFLKLTFYTEAETSFVWELARERERERDPWGVWLPMRLDDVHTNASLCRGDGSPGILVAVLSQQSARSCLRGHVGFNEEGTLISRLSTHLFKYASRLSAQFF